MIVACVGFELKIKVTTRTLICFFNGAQISKPSNPGRLGKGSRELDTHAGHGEVLSAAHSSNRNNKKLSGQVQDLHIGPISVLFLHFKL